MDMSVSKFICWLNTTNGLAQALMSSQILYFYTQITGSDFKLKQVGAPSGVAVPCFGYHKSGREDAREIEKAEGAK